jgi:hypothetical protein
MGKNRNYTNYSKPNKPAETAPEAKTDENVQNIQETENTKPTTNAAPDCETNQPDPEAQTPAANTASELDPEPSAPEDPDAVIGVVVNCERLNIRAEAKADAKILGTFFKGQEIELYLDTSTDEFYDVNVGYCMKKYIKINN